MYFNGITAVLTMTSLGISLALCVDPEEKGWRRFVFCWFVFWGLFLWTFPAAFYSWTQPKRSEHGLIIPQMPWYYGSFLHEWMEDHN